MKNDADERGDGAVTATPRSDMAVWDDIHALMSLAVQRGASDLHLTTESAPVIRVNGSLQILEGPPLTAQDTSRLLRSLLGPAQAARLDEVGEIDLSYSIPGVGRFRVNVYHQRGSLGGALRVIPFRVPTLDELGMPETLKALSRRENGLVLVTGPTGSGKSTTLAAMIDAINNERRLHILTLEDPIEYLHRHKNSIVNQREIGTDSQGFAPALRAALRQDPDVILVGEMRDLETMAIALTAAETGHLVLASLHTGTAAQAVNRIVDVFPPHQQEQVRVQLASTLQGVVAQGLLPRVDRPGRVAVLEILVATGAVRNLVREGKTHQLPSTIQTGSRYGMKTFEMSLRELLAAGIIGQEEHDAFLRREGFGSGNQPPGSGGGSGPAAGAGGYAGYAGGLGG